MVPSGRLVRSNLQNLRKWVKALITVILVLMASPSHAETVRVAAAASLRDVLNAIVVQYKQDTGHDVSLIFHASSALVRQIQAGARIDVFISADQRTMAQMTSENLIDPVTVVSVAANELVLVVSKESRWDWIGSPRDLMDPRLRRVALCSPAVPIGHYADALLRAEPWWRADALAGKVVRPDHVRAALTMVSHGAAPAAFVYRTDAALAADLVRIAYTSKNPGGLSIAYPAGMVRHSTQKDLAKRFLDYLATDSAKLIFREYGFLAPHSGS